MIEKEEDKARQSSQEGKIRLDARKETCKEQTGKQGGTGDRRSKIEREEKWEQK